MFKIFYLIILLIFITNCSVDTKTGIWENKKEPSIVQKLSDIKFNDELSFQKFRENAINYGKLSKFPKLDD
tara:strand:+ start:212 stop:424 length:213 start_codon:yes stop_codon:yes gene_type:complete